MSLEDKAKELYSDPQNGIWAMKKRKRVIVKFWPYTQPHIHMALDNFGDVWWFDGEWQKLPDLPQD